MVVPRKHPHSRTTRTPAPPAEPGTQPTEEPVVPEEEPVTTEEPATEEEPTETTTNTVSVTHTMTASPETQSTPSLDTTGTMPAGPVGPSLFAVSSDAILKKSDGVTVLSSTLNPVTLRQLQKNGLATSTDRTHTNSTSNSVSIDTLLQNATPANPISLGLDDIRQVPSYYPEKF